MKRWTLAHHSAPTDAAPRQRAALGLLLMICCAAASLMFCAAASAQSPTSEPAAVRVTLGDKGPTQSSLRFSMVSKEASAPAASNDPAPLPFAEPASAVKKAAASPWLEVRDSATPAESEYRRNIRARAMSRLERAPLVRTVAASSESEIELKLPQPPPDEGSEAKGSGVTGEGSLKLPQPPPDDEIEAKGSGVRGQGSVKLPSPRSLRTANLQPRPADEDLFAPPAAQPPAPPPAAQPLPAPAQEPPAKAPPTKESPFGDDPLEPAPEPMAPPPAAEPPAAPPANPKSKIENPKSPPPPPAPMLEPAAPVEPPVGAITQGNLLEVLSSSEEMTVTRRRNKILRSRENIYRVAVVDPAICDVVQFTPREVSIIGRGQGATNVTFWFADGRHKPLTYLVRVVPDPEIQVERERQYEIFEEVLAELFPDSKVRLTPVADKLIVRGQAKDAEEAAQILTIIRGEALAGRGGAGGYSYNSNSLIDGQAANPLSSDATGNPLPASNIVNMLRVPGVQQVALRVKIAELNRSAARHFGVNLDMRFDVGSGAMILQSLLNPPGTASIIGNFDNDQINFGIHFLKKHGVMRILSEPTLVTLSGRPASFVAGGEFAVPTTVGVDGAAAVTTDFRAFGVILNFLPTVIDKDRMRLEISPEFSKVNEDLSVGGTPGLTTRAVTTTVEMREGQTLAIAGLLEDSMEAKKEGDVPFLSTVFGKREVARNETELIILVTPELVHPLDPEEVPPLPGFDVTEPTDVQFFLAGRIEGTPTQEMRSTVWPRLRNRYRHGGPAMISGPFGHGQ